MRGQALRHLLILLHVCPNIFLKCVNSYENLGSFDMAVRQLDRGGGGSVGLTGLSIDKMFKKYFDHTIFAKRLNHH